MRIKYQPKFSAELLIEATRPSPAISNEDGTRAIQSFSTYTLETHSEFKTTKILDLETGKSILFTDDSKNSSFQWLTNDLVLWQREGDGGVTELWTQRWDKSDDRPAMAGKIAGSIDNLNTKCLPTGDIAVAFTAPADQDQNLFNSSNKPKSHTTAREWAKERPRIWDSHTDEYRSVLWYTTLEVVEGTDKYRLSENAPVNALRDSGLALPHFSDPLGDVSFDLSPRGIIFTTQDPKCNQWNLAWESLYYLPLSTFQETEVPPISQFRVPGHTGGYSSPKFTENGSIAAFIVRKTTSTWSKRSIILLKIDSPKESIEVKTFEDEQHKNDWDVFPDGLIWSKDDKNLIVTANDKAKARVFALPVTLEGFKDQQVVPAEVKILGSVSAVKAIGNAKASRLLVNSTSFVDPNTITVLSDSNDSGDDPFSNSMIIYSHSQDGSLFGVSSSQVSSINFPGGPDGRTAIQCWIFTPSSYDPQSPRKYPLFFQMHGGPQVAVTDSWSTRWNPLFFAEQGYIVAVPNYTGSDSFGRDFVNAINKQLGGYPYQDLENCVEWIEKNMPKCDITRAVAAGGSYGGYLANWVAGKPLGKRFKAIVCHDGIMDNFSEFVGDDYASTSFLREFFGDTYFDPVKSSSSSSSSSSDNDDDDDDDNNDDDAVTKSHRRFAIHNPIYQTHNWTPSTPMLFIHSDHDFRCQITAAWIGYNICKMKGIQTRMLNFPDENHWVLGKENSLKWLKTVMGWCNEFVFDGDGEDSGGKVEAEFRIKLEEPVSEAKWIGRVKPGRIVEAS